MICVLGDANLDVVVCPSGPVAEETDTPSRISVGAGGQAANVAAWITALGGQARLIAARGTDPASLLITDDLARRGVDLAGPVIDGHTGVVVSLSDGGVSRSMLTDRGVGPLLDASALADEWLDGCTSLHLPAYSLVREPVAGAALAAAREAAPAGDRPVLQRPRWPTYGVDRFRALLTRLRPQIVFGNEAEAALIGDLPGSDLVVKLGPRGVRAGGRVHAAHPARAVDPTGAGDAFAAGYLLGGVRIGLEAAARAVAQMGAMP